MTSSRQTTSLKSVIAITEKEDAHLAFVEPHLSASFIVIDPAGVMADEELSFFLHKDKLKITHKGRLLNNVGGVWLRRRWVFPEMPIPPAYKSYTQSAMKRHTGALYTHLEKARWVSDRFAMARAGYKPLQLQVAARLGLKVPKTLFTSSSDQARKFIDSSKTVITKPIGDFWIQDREKGFSLLFYSTKIHQDEKIDLSGLARAPAIFQEAIDTMADLRVTVIGDEIFPAIIVDKKVDSSSPVRDWRVGHFKGKLHIEPYKLPKDIANKCVALVKELGLEFGAIDLVLDKKGEIWFLENNANGQWAFVEEATGQPIGKAMADLLQGKG